MVCGKKKWDAMSATKKKWSGISSKIYSFVSLSIACHKGPNFGILSVAVLLSTSPHVFSVDSFGNLDSNAADVQLG